jgi:hypothetical protein
VFVVPAGGVSNGRRWQEPRIVPTGRGCEAGRNGLMIAYWSVAILQGRVMSLFPRLDEIALTPAS